MANRTHALALRAATHSLISLSDLANACGHVGCCDTSKNKHARKHFHAVGHPIMQSIGPGESWGWCYVADVELEFA